MSLHETSRSSVSDQVIRQMKENIAQGVWLPGKRLPGEMQLCEIFGVSRVTVRNALQKLAGEGLIETKLGDGSYVKQVSISEAMAKVNVPGGLTDQEFRELVEFRCVMEGPLCEMAVSRMTQTDLETLRRSYDAMCSMKQNESGFAKADLTFHTLLASCCGNQILESAYRMICTNLSRAMEDIVHRRGESSGLKFHKAILEAAESRDARGARLSMEAHMQEMAAELL